MKKWENIPENIRIDQVKPYYEQLNKHKVSLCCKRIMDLLIAILLLVVLFPFLLIIGIIIASTSKGGVFFLQERVTTYGRRFKIIKFRTMVADAEKKGSLVTRKEDNRITGVGKFLRKVRLDELPQLINIIKGDMSLVGTRPEVPKYVEQYEPEMLATLLMPAGVTSKASIMFKDEDELLAKGSDVDKIYVQEVLPEKMKYNLEYIKEFTFFNDIKLMFQTVLAVLR